MSPARRHRGTPPDRRGHASIAVAGPAGYSGLAGSVTALSSGRSILARLGAVFAIDAAASIPGEQWALNQGTAGQVLRARYGSVGRGEIRNGTFVSTAAGTNVAGTTTRDAGQQPSTEVDVFARVALDSWLPTGLPQGICGQLAGIPSQASFGLSVNTSGALRFDHSDGTSVVATSSSIAVPFTAGQAGWVRATWRASDGRVQFFTAPDGEIPQWSQLGTNQTLRAGVALNASAIASLRTGASLVADYPNGIVHRICMSTTIGGPLGADINFAGARDLVTSFTGNHGIGIKAGRLVLPGAPGVYASTPDAAALDITGDLDLRALVQLDDWTPSAALSCILDKYYSGQQAYTLTITNAGFLRLYWSSDGTSGLTEQSMAPVPFADGVTGWVRATLDVNNGAGGHQVRFYTSTDGTTWTEFGTPAPGGFVTSVFASTAAVAIGISTGGVSSPLAGKVHRAVVRAGIDGPAVLDVDFAGQPDNTQTFTGNHGIGIKSGALVAPGLPGCFASVAHTAPLNVTGDIEIEIRWSGELGTPGASYQTFLSKLGANTGYRFDYIPGRRLECAIGNGATFIGGSSAPIPAGARGAKVTVQLSNGSNSVFTFFTTTDGTTWTQCGSPNLAAIISSIATNAGTVGIGANPGGVEPFTGSVTRAVVRAGIDGPAVLDVDFAGQPDNAQTFACSTGQTVTVNGAARPTVTVNGCALPTVTVTASNAVDTNDPLLCGWTGENYWGGTANASLGYGTASLTVSNTVTRYEIDAEIDFSTPGYKPLFDLRSSGTAQLLVYIQDALWCCRTTQAGPTQQFSVMPSGRTGVQRVKFAWETRPSAGLARLFIFDGTSWVQYGGDQAYPPGNFQNTAVTEQYALGGTAGEAVKLYSIKVLADGVTLYHADFTKNTNQYALTCTTGQTLAFNRPGFGRKHAMVTRPLWLFGSDDLMEIANNALLNFGAADDFTLVTVGRMWAHDVTQGPMISKKATSYSPAVNVGWVMLRNIDQLSLSTSDGTTISQDVEPLAADGVLTVATGIRFGAAKQLSAYVNNANAGTSGDGSSGNLSNTLPVMIGSVAGGVFADMELYAVGIFRRALTAAEIAEIVTAYNAA